MASLGDNDSVSVSDVHESSSNLDLKKNVVTQKLQKRDEERLAEITQKKIEKDSTVAHNESVDLFLRNFAKEKQTVDDWLSESDGVDKAHLTDHFDKILLAIQKLSKYLAESAMFLTAYELEKAQDSINQLQNYASEKRDIFIPKKKFAFKAKKKTTEKPKPVHQEKPREINMQITDCSFVDTKGQVLTKKANEVNQKDVALVRLEDCTIKLYGSPLALHVNHLKGCKVFTGPVSGSIFIDNCVDCVFVVGCQQLRIHNTTKTQFYIHVTSKAIIEDCNTVKFAPYNWTYSDLEDHYKISGLDKLVNNWDDVDDFNWLASDAHSPNWSVLPQAERVSSWEA